MRRHCLSRFPGDLQRITLPRTQTRTNPVAPACREGGGLRVRRALDSNRPQTRAGHHRDAAAGAPRVLFLPLRAEEILGPVLCAHARFHEVAPCFRGVRSSPPGFSSADPEAVADGSNPLTISHTARTIS